MNFARRFQAWIATAVTLIAVSVAVMASQRAFAQVGRSAQSLSQLPVAKVPGQAPASGAVVMDGDWLYIVKGNRLYKVQKSTMSVFQTVDLN